MSRIKLLLDEDVWAGLAAALRERSWDAAHVYEIDRGGQSDADQLTFAAQTGHAILTHNAKDFAPLVIEYFFEGRPHAGVILSPQIEKGELLRRMLRLLEDLSAEDIRNTVRYLVD